MPISTMENMNSKEELNHIMGVLAENMKKLSSPSTNLKLDDTNLELVDDIHIKAVNSLRNEMEEEKSEKYRSFNNVMR